MCDRGWKFAWLRFLAACSFKSDRIFHGHPVVCRGAVHLINITFANLAQRKLQRNHAAPYIPPDIQNPLSSCPPDFLSYIDGSEIRVHFYKLSNQRILIQNANQAK
jgi:hypothetical protein